MPHSERAGSCCSEGCDGWVYRFSPGVYIEEIPNLSEALTSRFRAEALTSRFRAEALNQISFWYSRYQLSEEIQVQLFVANRKFQLIYPVLSQLHPLRIDDRHSPQRIEDPPAFGSTSNVGSDVMRKHRQLGSFHVGYQSRWTFKNSYRPGISVTKPLFSGILVVNRKL